MVVDIMNKCTHLMPTRFRLTSYRSTQQILSVVTVPKTGDTEENKQLY